MLSFVYSVQGRRTCLENLRVAFTRKYLPDFVSDRKMTIADCVERCLKKGKRREPPIRLFKYLMFYWAQKILVYMHYTIPCNIQWEKKLIFVGPQM